MSTPKYKILIHSLEGTGHLNATIGIAQAMAKRGHEIIYVINHTVQTRLEKLGFRVIPLMVKDDQPKVDADGRPIDLAKMYAKFMESRGLFKQLSSLEKIVIMNKDKDGRFSEHLYKQCLSYNPQVQEALDAERPDMILTDQLLYLPALATLPVPWCAIMSVQPNSLFPYDQSCPPPLSGFSKPVDADKWNEFHQVLQEHMYKPFEDAQSRLNADFDFTPSGQYELNLFYQFSPVLNIYQYPKELDYKDRLPKSKHPFFSVDAFTREEPEELELPEDFQPKDGRKLIYLSMGSLSGFDVNLMKRLITILGRLPYKVIVAKGPLGDEFELADNMWGTNNLPQTSILPLVDLVITHGGNNTVCESFYAGKPMIVLPLFGDQYDNAQRLQETGYGVWLEPYSFDDNQLESAVHKLLNDKALNERLDCAKHRMKSENTKQLLCCRLEGIIADYIKGSQSK